MPKSACEFVQPLTQTNEAGDMTLETTDEEQESRHQSKTNQEHRATAPAIDVNDGGDRERHVQDVVDGRCDEVSAAP